MTDSPMLCRTRRANSADASRACELVRRSIVELCVEDHRADETALAEWLEDKTPAQFEDWIHSDQHFAVVAELEGALVGFGLLKLSGTIVLLYVAPEARFRGVSKALLSAIEQEALKLGIGELVLQSTLTALRFYERSGYLATGERARGFGCTSCYPMRKSLPWSGDSIRKSDG